MSISLIQSPQYITPSKNDIIFQFQSSTSSVVYYNLTLKEAVTGNVVNSLKCYTTPDYNNGSFVNLSKILSNAVTSDIDIDGDIVKEKTLPVFQYKLDILERLSGTSSYMSGASFSSTTYSVINGGLNVIEYRDYDYTDYTVGLTNSVSFLTDKPDNTGFINEYSREQLYFLKEGLTSSISLIVEQFNSSNVGDTYTYSISGTSSNHLIRLDVSPSTLKSQFNINLNEGDYYTIHLEYNNVRVSEKRFYRYKKLDCLVEPVNLMWSNRYGGVDSYQFINPQQTINVKRDLINKNNMRFKNGVYSNITGDVFNRSEDIVNVETTGSYLVTTRGLKDSESRWLKGLLSSDDVYVEVRLGDESVLVPVVIKENSYVVKRQRWNRQDIVYAQFSFSFSEDYIPNIDQFKV